MLQFCSEGDYISGSTAASVINGYREEQQREFGGSRGNLRYDDENVDSENYPQFYQPDAAAGYRHPDPYHESNIHQTLNDHHQPSYGDYTDRIDSPDVQPPQMYHPASNRTYPSYTYAPDTADEQQPSTSRPQSRGDNSSRPDLMYGK